MDTDKSHEEGTKIRKKLMNYFNTIIWMHCIGNQVKHPIIATQKYSRVWWMPKWMIIIRVLRLLFLCYFFILRFLLIYARPISELYSVIFYLLILNFIIVFLFGFSFNTSLYTDWQATHRIEQGASSAPRQKLIARWKRKGEDVPNSTHIHKLLKLMSLLEEMWWQACAHLILPWLRPSFFVIHLFH